MEMLLFLFICNGYVMVRFDLLEICCFGAVRVRFGHFKWSTLKLTEHGPVCVWFVYFWDIYCFESVWLDLLAVPTSVNQIKSNQNQLQVCMFSMILQLLVLYNLDSDLKISCDRLAVVCVIQNFHLWLPEQDRFSSVKTRFPWSYLPRWARVHENMHIFVISFRHITSTMENDRGRKRCLCEIQTLSFQPCLTKQNS